MVPGGATALGALGYVSAALELARQVEAQAAEAPDTIVIGVGSTCTTAGLLVGLHHAARLGIGFVSPPSVIAVRVTPWPVTSRWRIAMLAASTSRLLAELAGEPDLAVSASELRAHLTVDRAFIGRGYGKPTGTGIEAIRLFREAGICELDSTYSGKSAASLVRRIRKGSPRRMVYWATKSTRPLPEPDSARLASATAPVRRWMARARRRERY